MLIALSPQRLFRVLLACIVALVVLHVVTLGAALAYPVPKYERLHLLFDVNEERNIPSKFSTLQLAFASVLLLLHFRIARRQSSRDSLLWLMLAGVFAYLAVDEYYMIHERLTYPVRRWLGAGHVPTFAWVVPYAALVAAFAAACFRFWWRLPAAIRWQMAVAAVIYVGGGIGMEFIGSWLYDAFGKPSPQYQLEIIVEESMEMFGVALFIRTLAILIQARIGSLTFQFDTSAIESHKELMRDVESAERRKRERRAG